MHTAFQIDGYSATATLWHFFVVGHPSILAAPSTSQANIRSLSGAEGRPRQL